MGLSVSSTTITNGTTTITLHDDNPRLKVGIKITKTNRHRDRDFITAGNRKNKLTSISAKLRNIAAGATAEQQAIILQKWSETGTVVYIRHALLNENNTNSSMNYILSGTQYMACRLLKVQTDIPTTEVCINADIEEVLLGDSFDGYGLAFLETWENLPEPEWYESVMETWES